MADVARAAGVSPSTVSVVINGVAGARVHPDTRVRILRTAEELGYVPNSLARGLRRQRSEIVGFVGDRVSTTPYAVEMLLGADEAAQAAGLLVLGLDTRGDADFEALALKSLMQRQVDGMLYASMYHRRVLVPDLLHDVPTVLVNAVSVDRSVSSVVPDEFASATVAVQELVTAGHRRIAYINDRDKILARGLRLRAYKATLRRAGLAADPRYIVEEAPDALGGYRAMRRLLELPDRPTAVFCFRDSLAMGVYHAAAEAGLRIPTDLSVVGFDDLELIAGNLIPGLTTVGLPHYAMGAWALNQLVATMNDSGLAPTHHKITGTLHRRASVTTPPI